MSLSTDNRFAWILVSFVGPVEISLLISWFHGHSLETIQLNGLNSLSSI